MGGYFCRFVWQRVNQTILSLIIMKKIIALIFVSFLIFKVGYTQYVSILKPIIIPENIKKAYVASMVEEIAEKYYWKEDLIKFYEFSSPISKLNFAAKSSKGDIYYFLRLRGVIPQLAGAENSERISEGRRIIYEKELAIIEQERKEEEKIKEAERLAQIEKDKKDALIKQEWIKRLDEEYPLQEYKFQVILKYDDYGKGVKSSLLDLRQELKEYYNEYRQEINNKNLYYEKDEPWKKKEVLKNFVKVSGNNNEKIKTENGRVNWINRGKSIDEVNELDKSYNEMVIEYDVAINKTNKENDKLSSELEQLLKKRKNRKLAKEISQMLQGEFKEFYDKQMAAYIWDMDNQVSYARSIGYTLGQNNSYYFMYFNSKGEIITLINEWNKNLRYWINKVKT